eukprot:Gb_34383 [translate_table: standard]
MGVHPKVFPDRMHTPVGNSVQHGKFHRKRSADKIKTTNFRIRNPKWLLFPYLRRNLSPQVRLQGGMGLYVYLFMVIIRAGLRSVHMSLEGVYTECFAGDQASAPHFGLSEVVSQNLANEAGSWPRTSQHQTPQHRSDKPSISGSIRQGRTREREVNETIILGRSRTKYANACREHLPDLSRSRARSAPMSGNFPRSHSMKGWTTTRIKLTVSPPFGPGSFSPSYVPLFGQLAIKPQDGDEVVIVASFQVLFSRRKSGDPDPYHP